MADDKQRPPKRAATVQGPHAPPPAVAAQIAAPENWDREQTDPQAPLMEQIDHRTKRLSYGSDDIRGRITVLESGQTTLAQGHVDIKAGLVETNKTVALIQKSQAEGTGYLKALVDSTAAEDVARARREDLERKDREAAEARAHEITKIRLGYRVAMIVAIFSGAAGLITAIHAWLK